MIEEYEKLLTWLEEDDKRRKESMEERGLNTERDE
ncbi:hypothetical protein CA13_40790 [Planctomycetes bacterium CA13]|uniref:Uncharacterized protein n=1 Tax=Novipirellula herctigrandis TaxID=2527986 RepID=A0A5C5Z6B1_9BACT|nr:hypothetical protein CA13_40790 [Planctomycetes bacterium CA13]